MRLVLGSLLEICVSHPFSEAVVSPRWLFEGIFFEIVLLFGWGMLHIVGPLLPFAPVVAVTLDDPFQGQFSFPLPLQILQLFHLLPLVHLKKSVKKFEVLGAFDM